MGEEEVVKVESESVVESLPVPEPEPAGEASKDAAEEKSIESLPPSEEKTEECKALAVVEKDPHSGSINRDEALAKVETEKRLSLVKAWEESEKSKAENKAHKKLSEIGAWENCKKASVEAELKQIEEKLEKKKAEYVEKMKNKIALIHKSAEEKKAIVEAKKAESLLQAEETAAKYRATGTAPKKLLGLF